MGGTTTSSLRETAELPTHKGRYIYGDIIGKGSYGRVLKATDTETGDMVAIKILEFQWMNGENGKQEARNEVDILKQLCHENVISIRDEFEFRKWHIIPKGLAIVTEYCSNGSLLQLLIKRRSFVSEEQRFIWYKQLASALVYIHSKSIAHRDIKPANILVDQYQRLKIADVGISKVLHSDIMSPQDTSSLYMQTMCGTYPYTAPEVFEGHYTFKSDIFSMGLVMYVICELPQNLVPQVKQDLVIPQFLHTLHSLGCQTPGLGLYYKYNGKLDAMGAMMIRKCNEDEKSIFSWILQPTYESRPDAAEVLDMLNRIEEERKRRKEDVEKAKRQQELEMERETRWPESGRRMRTRQNRERHQTKCIVI